LAEDLKRFQTGQLVSARTYSAAVLIRRWLGRHLVPVSISAAFLLVLTTVSLWGLRRIIHERNMAKDRRNELILVQAKSSIDRDPAAGGEWMKTYPDDENDGEGLRGTALDANLAGVPKHFFRAAANTTVRYVALPQTADLMASAGRDRLIRIWD